MPLPPTPPSPGPGQYEVVDYEGPEQHYMSSSVFVSSTSRWTGAAPKQTDMPGPGMGFLHITNPVVLVMTWCLFSAKSLAESVVTSTQKSSLAMTISVVYNWYQPGGEHVYCFYHTGIGIWRFSYSGGNWEKFAWYWTDTESWPPSVIFMCLVRLSWYLWTDSSI